MTRRASLDGSPSGPRTHDIRVQFAGVPSTPPESGARRRDPRPCRGMSHTKEPNGVCGGAQYNNNDVWYIKHDVRTTGVRGSSILLYYYYCYYYIIAVEQCSINESRRDFVRTLCHRINTNSNIVVVGRAGFAVFRRLCRDVYNEFLTVVPVYTRPCARRLVYTLEFRWNAR